MIKTKYIQIRVTDDERQLIEKAMHKENFSSMSEYIRKTMKDRAHEVLR